MSSSGVQSIGLIAAHTADRLNPLPHGGIGDVRTIPGQQIVHAVHCCDADMQSIRRRVLW